RGVVLAKFRNCLVDLLDCNFGEEDGEFFPEALEVQLRHLPGELLQGLCDLLRLSRTRSEVSPQILNTHLNFYAQGPIQTVKSLHNLREAEVVVLELSG